MRIFNKLRAMALLLMLTFTTAATADSIWSPMTDSVNSGIINTKMATDDALDNIRVDATVINGIAIFIGQVNSQAQFDELVRIAGSVSGIKGVNTSKLTIRK